ncbi:hypothetical protein ACFC0C_28365 [Streptomyces sp. NPDC056178]|uniref:hypothetical protein n=1 Tax=Streptomyces sp. NPDC056178 TaxID=3345735 RepID=UPI0035E11437
MVAVRRCPALHRCGGCSWLRGRVDGRRGGANLHGRGLQEAKEQGWLGEVAAIEASLAAAEQKLTAMRDLAARHTTVHLGMPDFRSSAGRLDAEQ